MSLSTIATPITSLSIEEEDLRQYFQKYGEIKKSQIIKDSRTGISRHFGFITFTHHSSANKAVEDKIHVILGKSVQVNIPRPETKRNSLYTNNPLMNPKKIFVGGLPSSLTDEEFKDYFTRFGNVYDPIIIKDKESNTPRGFGFVSFDSEEVVKSILQTGPHVLNDKVVDVKPAIRKEGMSSYVNMRCPLDLANTYTYAYYNYETNQYFSYHYETNLDWYINYNYNYTPQITYDGASTSHVIATPRPKVKITAPPGRVVSADKTSDGASTSHVKATPRPKVKITAPPGRVVSADKTSVQLEQVMLHEELPKGSSIENGEKIAALSVNGELSSEGSSCGPVLKTMDDHILSENNVEVVVEENSIVD